MIAGRPNWLDYRWETRLKGSQGQSQAQAVVLTDLRTCPQGKGEECPGPLDKSDLQGRGALMSHECLHQDGQSQLLHRERGIGKSRKQSPQTPLPANCTSHSSASVHLRRESSAQAGATELKGGPHVRDPTHRNRGRTSDGSPSW